MWIKKFSKYKESLVIDIKDGGLNESLGVLIDSILNAIGAESVDPSILKLKNTNLDLEFLNKDSDFINSLSSNNLKKSDMQLSTDYETFLKTPCRFMFIYNKDASELENPYYLLLQLFGENKWQTTNVYKINDDIKKFYDQLSSKVIEIEDGGEKFIYETGNGNEWTLKSVKETDVYKRNFDKEDLEKVIQDRKAKVKII